MADPGEDTPTGTGAAVLQKAAELRAALQRKLKKARNKRFYDKKKLMNKLMYVYIRTLYILCLQIDAAYIQAGRFSHRDLSRKRLRASGVILYVRPCSRWLLRYSYRI